MWTRTLRHELRNWAQKLKPVSKAGDFGIEVLDLRREIKIFVL